jgi:hypothetical protein
MLNVSFAREGAMNHGQRLQVIVALVVIGAILSFIMLDWQDGWRYGSQQVLVFYEGRSPGQRTGLYTRYGVMGIMLGVVVALCLSATAAFIGNKARYTLNFKLGPCVW